MILQVTMAYTHSMILAVLSNLTGSLTRKIEHHSLPSEWKMHDLKNRNKMN